MHLYLIRPQDHGHQPQARADARRGREGNLRWHALGCRQDGGAGLPHGVCMKCDDGPASQYLRALMRIDRAAS